MSATALLSTTVQAAMLLRRILNSRTTSEEYILFGTRAYVFTDNLDVVNRLYFDLRDAEGDGPTQDTGVQGACGPNRTALLPSGEKPTLSAP